MQLVRNISRDPIVVLIKSNGRTQEAMVNPGVAKFSDSVEILSNNSKIKIKNEEKTQRISLNQIEDRS